MISTAEQYEATQQWVAIFEKKLRRLASKDDGADPRVLKLEMDSYTSMIESLQRELAEYEAQCQPSLVGAESAEGNK